MLVVHLHTCAFLEAERTEVVARAECGGGEDEAV
jgi:hypothetical protein